MSMLSSPIGTVPSRWTMAMPLSPCFALMSLHSDSIVLSANAPYAEYCSSLTGFPPKLSLVVPDYVLLEHEAVIRFRSHTCEKNNGSGLWAAYPVHDILHV